MPIVPSGSTNLAAAQVPGVIVQIIPPSPLLNGVSTNVIGVVGTATWGGVNSPTVVGSLQEYVQKFGQLRNATYDMGTQVYTALSQGANSFLCVRVTDGNDLYAGTNILDTSAATAVRLNALYTGTTGNSLVATLSVGSGNTTTSPKYKLTVYLAGGVPEVYDSIGGSGAALWQNIANAVNLGQSNLRGPSQLVKAITGGVYSVPVTTPGSGYTSGTITFSGGGATTSATAIPNIVGGVLKNIIITNPGAGYTTAPTVTFTGVGGTGAVFGTPLIAYSAAAAPTLPLQYSFSGGTNGVLSVNDATLVGSDVVTPRSGMYALRKTNASLLVLSDQTDGTKFSEVVSFCLTEGMYGIGTLANNYSNDVAGAVTAKATAGIDTYAFKLMTGDWILINDPVTGLTRFVSPQGFMAGILAALLPSNSSLNKQLSNVVATQKTSLQQVYSDADLLTLSQGGLDVITNPIPLSQDAFGGRLGVNTSSNPVINGDNYPRMINFLAKTFEKGLGLFIGKPQTPAVQLQAKNTLQTFLQNLVQLGMIGTVDGSPAYKVTLDKTNNPPSRVALGFMQADIQVTLFSIIVNLVVNLQAGQSVQIQVASTQSV